MKPLLPNGKSPRPTETRPNNRGRWRWTKPMAKERIWRIVATVAVFVAVKLLDALADAVIGEALNALLKHLLA